LPNIAATDNITVHPHTTLEL